MNAKIRYDLPRDRTAPSKARRLVAEQTSALPAKRRNAAQLLVSELVSNAVVHGRGKIELTVDVGRGRFEVRDEGGGRPKMRDDPGPTGGWGLRLVDQLALRWGLREGHTCVWFDV
jgi:anti-sigma regulatory factor (Ser/Thr protein kinase)